MNFNLRLVLWTAFAVVSVSKTGIADEKYFNREDRLSAGITDESGQVYAPFCIKRAPLTNKCQVVRIAYFRNYSVDQSALVRSRFDLGTSSSTSGQASRGTITVDGLAGSEFSPAMMFAQTQFLEAAVTKSGTREIARNLYRFRAVEFTWQDAVDRKKASKYPQHLTQAVEALFSSENTQPTLIRSDLIQQIIGFSDWLSSNCNLFPVIENAIGGRKGAHSARIAQDYHAKFLSEQPESQIQEKIGQLPLGSGLTNGNGQYLKPICLDWTQNGCRRMRFELISPAGSNGSAQTDLRFSRLDLSHLTKIDEQSLEALGQALNVHSSEWGSWKNTDSGTGVSPELSGVEWAQVLACKDMDSQWRKAIRDSLNQGENWTLWSEAKPLSRKDFKALVSYLSGDFRHQLYNCGVQR